jgi:hypothetical protein
MDIQKLIEMMIIDELQFNKEDYDGHGDDEIKEEEDNSD